MAEARQFLRWFTTITLSLFVLIAAVNWIVDPFNLFHFPRIEGFNAEKPEYGRHVRMIKAHEIRLGKPKGLILGSSRAETGLDPEHPGWRRDSRPVFNLALPSCSIYEAYVYLRHAHAVNPVRQVVLGLDLFMFNANRQTEPDFSPSRLAIPHSYLIRSGWLRDLVTALISYDALAASYQTVMYQKDPYRVPHLANGQLHHTRNWKKIQKKGGHHKAMLSNERYSVTAKDGWHYFSLRAEDGKSLPTTNTFSSIIEFCRQNDIDLKLFISPIHARKLEVMHQVGIWSTFEHWKRELVKVITANNTVNLGQPPITLWDFSGYNRITTEPVPPLNDTKTQMNWYWEGSHYKNITGNLILDKLFHSADEKKNKWNDFGVRLTPENTDAHLLSVRQARAQYAASHPDDTQEIENLVEAANRHQTKESIN